MPVENVYDLGDDPLVGYTLANDDGILVDGTVAANSVDPAGASAALVATRVATGTYEARLAPATPGRWLVRFTSTGTYPDSETVGLVFRPNAPVRPDDSYATIDDVIRFTQGRTFNASSKPAIGDVVDYLNFSKGEIDGLLRRVGYTLPVATGATSALALLANGNAMGAACMVETSAPIANRSSTVCKCTRTSRRWCSRGTSSSTPARTRATAHRARTPRIKRPRCSAATCTTPAGTGRCSLG